MKKQKYKVKANFPSTIHVIVKKKGTFYLQIFGLIGLCCHFKINIFVGTFLF